MMLVPAIFALATGMAQAALPMPAGVEAFADEATGWLLEGRRLPPDYRLRLLNMPPADRLQAIVFLRRAGLLSGTAWSLADVLRPAAPEQENAE